LWYFWQFFPILDLIFYILFSFAFFFGIIILIISSAFIARIFLIFTNLIHKPREGVYVRSKRDKDYCYWSLRALIRKWPTWLARQLSLPLLENLVLKILGLGTSLSNSLYEGWIDCEFIKFGKNVKVGQGSFIISNIIINNQDHRTKARFEENLIRFGPLQDTLYLHYLDRKTVTIYANYTKIINGQFIPLLDTMITSKDTLWILR